jgi:predicted nucleic-acid-binding Zn-ribbon protein
LEGIVQGTEERVLRNAAICKACREHGYIQAQIAAATGLHYSKMSKLIRKTG